MISKHLLKEENKCLLEVLTEMCNRVGADINKLDLKKDRWYWEYVWSKEDEEDFRKWFVNYLYHNPKRQRSLIEGGYAYYHKPKKLLRRFVNMFLFNHGWALETDEERKRRLRKEKIDVINEFV